MALIGAILVEIKIIEILCERSLREGDRHALNYGIARSIKDDYFGLIKPIYIVTRYIEVT
jgi:hypothetical protein